MKALITGINGQDGSYLSEQLIETGIEVFGIVRRHSYSESQQIRLEHLRDKINTEYGDLTDQASIEKIISSIKPDLIFNLGAQSHVRVSFDIPVYTAQVNALGTLNVLDAYRRICPDARYYQASSSEMFGLSVDEDGYQRETTPMNPVSPYGCAKVFGYNITRHYRRAYKLFACNGILFNHESPRRGANFVSQKIVKAAVAIKYGLQDKIELGNMDSYRDWGHSKDYTAAMIKIINHTEPSDFIVSSMQAHSIREMCEVIFLELGMDYKKYLVQNTKYMRPEELPYLKGDSTKARTVLQWEPQYTFKTMLQEMITEEEKKYN